MAGLRTYRAKRDFGRTREPRGAKARRRGDLFVIQKYSARRLHYDLRLELDGVLKSWAVTKGPSLVPSEKRLAVEVEDHPLDYAGFEGTIPKGQYGGGSVIVWDRGSWTPDGDARKALSKGHLDFTLDGEKLHGRWHLVRMRRRRSEKKNNWLLVKGMDDAARKDGEADILEEEPKSVVSGRHIEEIKEENDVWDLSNGRRRGKKRKAATSTVSETYTAKKATTAISSSKPARRSIGTSKIKGAYKAALPKFVEPCLATLNPKAPEGSRWIHEIKFDGYRLQARIDGGKVQLLTRAGLDWTRKFGNDIITAFKQLPIKGALIDGELVVENEAGASDFSALQAALSEGRTGGLIYYAFDLLYADGYDLRKVALTERKAALATILAQGGRKGPLRYSEHFEENGALVLEQACRLSLEGIVSKVRNAPYRSGRGKDWLKSKCSARQEFVIAGFVPSTASNKAIGSLAVGHHEKGKLVYAGRVGTGFSQKVARDLYRRLNTMRIDNKPFAQTLSTEETRHVTWVEPELVAEVEFRGWTGAHILRHAAFHGLREDKPDEQVVREDAMGAKTTSSGRRARFGVTLTHPDRIYWPDAGLTKQGLAEYYADIWKWIAPHAMARPLALLRCPHDIDHKCFFQKRPWKGLHPSVAVIRNRGKGGDEFLAIENLDGLVALVQGGGLEVHPWGATVGNLGHPDRLIFDLDPGPGSEWSHLVEAALELRDRLKQQGLKSFVKTTGGKGLHVVVPLQPKADWTKAKAFARGLAELMAKERPERYTATVSKQARKGRIFIDYLRNSRGATAIVPYGTRARAGAPVAMPLAWDELGPDISGDYFRVANAMNRLDHLSRDPWAGFFKLKQTLPAAQAKPRRSRKK